MKWIRPPPQDATVLTLTIGIPLPNDMGTPVIVVYLIKIYFQADEAFRLEFLLSVEYKGSELHGKNKFKHRH